MLTGDDVPAPSGKVPSLPSARTGQAGVQATSVIQGTHAAWGETKPPKAAKRSKLGIVAGLVLGPLLGAGAWWAFGSHGSPATSPEGSVAGVTGAEPPRAAPVVPARPELRREAPPPVPVEVVAPAPPPIASSKPAPVPAAAAARKMAAAPAKPPAQPAAVAAAAPASMVPPPVAKPVPETKKPSAMGGRL